MALKIYFAGSIRGGRDDAALYARLIELLRGYGEVLTEHVGNQNMLDKEVDTDKYIHDRDVAWLEQCDVLVAEVTQVSMGVGYELGRAVAMGKPVLCLYRPVPGKRLSAMVEGARNDDSFIVKHYQEAEVAEIFKEHVGKLLN